ncbi:MAG: hypothetical protein MHM6MM_006718, partial [Cercozoa sp. M6MM]
VLSRVQTTSTSASARRLARASPSRVAGTSCKRTSCCRWTRPMRRTSRLGRSQTCCLWTRPSCNCGATRRTTVRPGSATTAPNARSVTWTMSCEPRSLRRSRPDARWPRARPPRRRRRADVASFLSCQHSTGLPCRNFTYHQRSSCDFCELSKSSASSIVSIWLLG